MKKVIEEIEKIKGVEKVTETGCNELTVQVEKKKQAVECTNKEQLTFAFEREIKSEYCRKYKQGCIYLDHEGWNLKEDIEGHVELIPFSQYLSDYNLKDEWGKYLIGEAEKRYPVGTLVKSLGGGGGAKITSTTFKIRCAGTIENHRNCSVYENGKWATIIEPELELISGEIYYINYGEDKRIVRVIKKDGKFCVYYYSQLLSSGLFYEDSEMEGSLAMQDIIPLPATNKQKAKLIKSELKNGYLWNGKELVKYKYGL